MLPEIKKHFFALRNGIVADTLRKAGMPYKIIFGLQVPQLAEIARSLSQDMTLADELWNDRDVRESRLLACYLFPISETDMNKALALARDARTKEEGDMLAFRLFKKLDFADSLLAAMDSDPEISDATAESLRNHLT